MLVDEMKAHSPNLREQIKRIESYYNLVVTTEVAVIKEYYKDLLKKNLVMLTREGVTIDLQRVNYIVDSLN